MKMKPLLYNHKQSKKIDAKNKISNDNSSSSNKETTFRSSSDFLRKSLENKYTKVNFTEKNEIIIRDIPTLTKSIHLNNTNINYSNSDIQVVNDEKEDKLTSLQKLNEMVFDNDKHNSDDDPLLISFSVKKGKSIKNDKRIKKTKRQLIEEKMLEVDDNEIRSIVRQLEDKIDREIN